MTDPKPADPKPAERKPADPARQRFFALNLFRLSGALIAAFGLAIGARRFDWVQGDAARTLGAIVLVVGLLQFLIVPRLLARAWRTPPAP